MRNVAVACIGLVLGVAPLAAHAEPRQVCLGLGLHCETSTSNYYSTGDVDRRNQRIAAGMEAAGALVNLLGVVLDIVGKTQGSNGGGDQDADRDVIRRLEQGERVEECRMAQAWQASGVRQLRVRDYTSAEAHFAAALKHARDGHCDNLLDDYERNANLATAQSYLLMAIEFIGAKRYKEAENQLMVATNFAFAAREKDLENRIRAYRLQLHDKIDKGKPFKDRTSCIEVNGKMECD